jgi:hypothetical protein
MPVLRACRAAVLGLTALLSALLAVGCGSSSDPVASRPEPSAAPSVSQPVAPSAIVGTWARLQRCHELVRVLRAAHLGTALPDSIAGDGWVPGVTEASQVDPRHPCRGAVARVHSHFFTADGQFGSRDADGNQVDDGSYTLVGDDQVVVGGVTFHYTIAGDQLALLPTIPSCRPRCFEAQWSVQVAFPGYTWQRTE